MSSSVSGAMSAGAQLLANDNLLPSNLSQNQLASATPDQLAKMAGATMPLQNTNALFGDNTSPGADTVQFSPEAMSLLQQMGGDFGSSNGSSSTALTPYASNSAIDSFDLFG